MPTGTKLVAAVFFFVVAYVAAQQVRAIMPESSDLGLFYEIMGVVGALCGWVVMGRRVGDGIIFSMSAGLLTSVAIIFWGLVIFSTREMLALSLKKKYDGPTEAIVDIFRIAVEHGENLTTAPSIAITLGVGGIVGGLVAEWANRRYS